MASASGEKFIVASSAGLDPSELKPSSSNDVELVLCTELNAVQITTGNIHGLSYYDLNIGDTYKGQYTPQFHRAISIPQSDDISEGSEYMMVNNDTQTILYYELNEISPSNLGTVLGISVLILTEECIKEIDGFARHAVLQSKFLGQPCFLGTRLPEGLGLVTFEKMGVRFNKKKSSAMGYHGLVVPIEPMALDNFISRFTQVNWALDSSTNPSSSPTFNPNVVPSFSFIIINQLHQL